MRRRRHLSAEERDLWGLVTRQTQPMRATRAPSATKPKDDAEPERRSAPPDTGPTINPLPRFRLGEAVDHSRSNDLLPGLAEQMGRAPVNMDAKGYGKLKRGKLVPEARIDLHGMTLSEAHPALTGFLLGAHARGQRLVLVITGKGKARDYEAPMPARQGILRHQVPQWLGLPPLRDLVLQIVPAHIRHGGQGAYYVYLRRPR